MSKKFIGEWSVVPLILTLKTRWLASSLSYFTHWEVSPCYPWNGRLSGPQIWSGCIGKEGEIYSRCWQLKPVGR